MSSTVMRVPRTTGLPSMISGIALDSLQQAPVGHDATQLVPLLLEGALGRFGARRDMSGGRASATCWGFLGHNLEDGALDAQCTHFFAKKRRL
jgi:hypothetical protein